LRTEERGRSPQFQFGSSGPALDDFGGFALAQLTTVSHRIHLDVEVLTAGCWSSNRGGGDVDMGLISVLIGVLVIVVVGAICFWAIDKFANDRRLANLLKLLVVLICLGAILQRVLPLAY
jgi:hypothetical protein